MTCPICGKTTVAAYRPFCSRRCADIDLGRWLTGGYVIPGDAGEDEETPSPGGRDPGDDPGGRRH
ncbi:DNA gyrase inhibitor YacG [Frigidibacter oleivorans]|uniref:DNA gyrase inhibitor YacG n=1 Tax=Frigidibacter oleivorans TaxID=2487129 RepID=UPI000F8C8E29|nr:DNA gyrase inhibitor YacG [Frigidibacter oleivorans]